MRSSGPCLSRASYSKKKAKTVNLGKFGYNLAWLDKGDIIAGSGLTKDIVVFDLKNTKVLKTIETEFPVRVMAASPDGKWLAANAVGPADPHVMVWDSTTWKGKALAGPRVIKLCMQFTPDSKTLVMGQIPGAPGSDGPLSFWDAATANLVFTMPAKEMDGLSSIFGLAVSPKGKTVAIATISRDRIYLWDIDNRRPRGQLLGKDAKAMNKKADVLGFRCVAYSPDGTHVAAGYVTGKGEDKGYVKLWKVPKELQD